MVKGGPVKQHGGDFVALGPYCGDEDTEYCRRINGLQLSSGKYPKRVICRPQDWTSRSICRGSSPVRH
ncbi:MAG: hypothetical protein BroJett029_21580 [Alphaproteobacteria bacterium]|nr:MAG: hypothetical protein BroJett029_21580 [Alphaproteobacteria bacterium]